MFTFITSFNILDHLGAEQDIHQGSHISDGETERLMDVSSSLAPRDKGSDTWLRAPPSIPKAKSTVNL